jgi:hypothetical protein
MVKLLFGVEQSPFRRLCAIVAAVIVVGGIVLSFTQGWAIGVPFALVGLVAVVVFGRSTATHASRVATSEQLSRVTGEFNSESLRQVVEHAKTDPNSELGRVTGRFDSDEIQSVVEQVRSENPA